ncbi:MAG: hypothetical protein ACR2NZ_01610, partial [Rubripirellula sp.]
MSHSYPTIPTRMFASQYRCATLLLILIPSVTSVAISHGKEQEEKTLRAGAAAANITPPLGETVVGGFAPFPADRIHDELHARSVVLDNGQTTIA